MLSYFTKICDFSLFYDYINKLGKSIEVLRIPSLDKTKLKSNHYWIMPLLTKLPALRAFKMHKHSDHNIGPDFFKFVSKGMAYLQKTGRSFEKIQINDLLGSASADNLYACLKPHPSLIVLDFSNNKISTADAKAIGKVLTDFRNIRELNMNNSNLDHTTTKEIADGLMRAKQLEVFKAANNTGMATSVKTILYNLAFSPRIRHVDISDMGSADAEVAEALYKLIKISGAIEILILKNTGVNRYLTEDFYKAIGENKTLQYLNLDFTQATNNGMLGKAVAMNAYKNGALTSLSIMQFYSNNAYLQGFLMNMSISVKDHEKWYGEEKIANKMEKEDLKKHTYCNLKFCNMGQNTISGMPFNYKKILKQSEPTWPLILEWATKT